MRFTNGGLQLDHQPQNVIKWYVKIPHHKDYDLWIPTHANSDQREWLEALCADDAETGKLPHPTSLGGNRPARSLRVGPPPRIS